MQDKKEKLFVYGILLNKKVQNKRIGRIIKGKKYFLIGYKKVKIKVCGKIHYALIKNSKKDKTKGKILSVTKKELEQIDKFETKKYIRKKVKLSSNKNIWFYLKNEKSN